MADSGLLFTRDFQLSMEEMPEMDAKDVVRASLPAVEVKGTDLRSLQKVLKLVKQLDEMEKTGGVSSLYETPYSIDELPKHREFFRSGIEYPERLFMAGNRVGKALRITEPVLTPEGWTAIGELKIGDVLLTPDGGRTSVVGIYDQGMRDIYRVHFNDGTYVDCDLEHLWKCKGPDERFRKKYKKGDKEWDNPSYGKWQVKSLKEIVEHVGMSPKPPRRYSIPVVEKLSYPERDFPVDPYTLGVLLGDGSTKQECVLHSIDPEILSLIEWIPDRESYQDTTDCASYHFTGKLNLLREAGIYGASCYDKSVPCMYKHSNERLAVLQGLMDTDGYTNGAMSEFVSVSKSLAQDVCDIARSLGIRCTLKEKKTAWTYKGIKKHSKAWRVCLWTTDVPLFRLSRKANKQRMGVKKNGNENVVVKVEKIGTDLARCIEVDSEDKTYIVSNYVVTHNTIAGGFELKCHLTGDYPIWWAGKRFDEPIRAWAVGKDAKAVRDTIQKELIGPIGEWGTGLLPAHTLGKFFALQGTPQAIDIIKVKHKTGGWSELGFKNYQQDIGSFMGTSREVIWLDEECPMDIYNECNIRTATVDGIMMVTFTPLDGLTPMVVNFCKNADFLVGAKPIVAVDTSEDEVDMPDYNFTVGNTTSKAVIQAGWNDAPWLSEEMKARLLRDTPEHLRKARSEGIPAMGSGNVYSTPLEDVLVEPFAIPENWPRMYAMDVGWNRTAVVWAALDPATDTVYLYDEHYRGQQEPPFHAHAIRSRGDWILGVIDPASNGRSQVDGLKLIESYKELGLDLRNAKNELEAGILNIQQRLTYGKLRVFKTLVNWQKEYMLYSRDKHGRPIQQDDHIMDATRYVINNMKYMSSKADHVSPTAGAFYSETIYDI